MNVQSIAGAPPRRSMALFALLASLALAAVAAAAEPAALVVDGAASLTDSLQRVGDGFTATTHIPVKFSFAASSALARQIEAGAPADVFFSADPDWMDYLEQRHLIRSESRRNLLGNRLALVAPADSKLVLHIEPHFALRAALGQERLATGDPDVVPVGRYARAALTSLGVWDEVADRLVRAENVRSALIFVARGEVPLGIVYETDARVDPKVRIVDLFPTETHPPIIYPAAMTSTASPNAQRFMEFLRTPAARATFEKFGFTVLP
jgi:molybdate transport system substrate-binding protein